jgi:tetratricopeptide (TPR) repeat protein
LGTTNFYLGNYNTAKQYFTNASQIYQAIGEQKGESGSLMSLGLLHTHTGNYLAGREKYKEALAVSHQIGYRMGQTLILGNLGVNYGDVGEYEAARECQEQTLNICQEIGDPEGESFALCNLTLIHYNLRKLEIARHTSSQALAIHRKIGDRRNEGYTLTYLGHTLADSSEWQAAKEAYEKAIEVRRTLGEEKLIIDDLAGLAHIAMREGNNAQAITHVEEILAWIESNGAEGIEYPLQVYLTCYQVLEANSDNDPTASARADTILVRAHSELTEQAAKIKDEALRHNFLENVSFNRELRRLWDARNG